MRHRLLTVRRPPSPPPRPSPLEEKLAQRLFLALAPRLRPEGDGAPPARFAPFEVLRLRGRRGGGLAATWFPAPAGRRGAVLMLPPWLAAGRAYLHRRGRIQALRAAGYDVLTVDLPAGRGRGAGFFDRDVEDAIAHLARAAGGSIHLWGVSSGGYWAHPALARGAAVSGAFFEDVSPHLLEWSRRVIPWGRPCYAFFRLALPAAYRFLDMRAHAAALRLRATAYVGGGADRGVAPGDTADLARAARGVCRIVAGADHLGAIKTARREVIDLALATFERAVAAAAAASPPPPAPARRADDRCPPGRCRETATPGELLRAG